MGYLKGSVETNSVPFFSGALCLILFLLIAVFDDQLLPFREVRVANKDLILRDPRESFRFHGKANSPTFLLCPLAIC